MLYVAFAIAPVIVPDVSAEVFQLANVIENWIDGRAAPLGSIATVTPPTAWPPSNRNRSSFSTPSTMNCNDSCGSSVNEYVAAA